MKKGMFFSLTALFFIIIVFVVVFNSIEVNQKKEQVELDRIQLLRMNQFNDDFKSYYLPYMLQSALKPALIDSSTKVVDINDIVVVMDDPIQIGSKNMVSRSIENALATLTFSPDQMHVEFTINSIEPIQNFKLRVVFSVNYTIQAFETTWSEVNYPVVVTVDVYGLYHRSYGTYITPQWTESSMSCYTQSFIADALPCTKDFTPP